MVTLMTNQPINKQANQSDHKKLTDRGQMSWPNGIDIGQKIRHVEQSLLVYKIYLYVKWFASYSRHPISRNSPELLLKIDNKLMLT